MTKALDWFVAVSSPSPSSVDLWGEKYVIIVELLGVEKMIFFASNQVPGKLRKWLAVGQPAVAAVSLSPQYLQERVW